MWDYKKSKTRAVKGGIKADTKRGTFGKRWWGKQWIKALESFNDAARLGRGRSYARKGQVISIHIAKGQVVAKVQGSRKTPYEVTIGVDTLSASAWQGVIEALSNQALYAAKLLAGEMPDDIQQIFDETEISLLPTTHNELWTDCSCPDWSNPCKHVAAVYYLLAEEFDRDPFLIFKMRGIERDTFLHLLETHANLPQESPSKEDQAPEESLPTDLNLFWKGKELPKEFNYGQLTPPETPGALLHSLGKFPFWRGEEPLEKALNSIYQSASKTTLDALLEERTP